MTQNNESDSLKDLDLKKLAEEAEKLGKKRIEDAFKELYDGDEKYKEILAQIQNKESAAIQYVKNISTNKKIMGFLGTIALTGATPGGGVIASKVITQLSMKSMSMIAVNGALAGLAAINIIYMFVLWKSIYDTSQIVMKKIPSILDDLAHQKKNLMEFAQFVADGDKIPVRQLDHCKKSLARLNERCAKCISSLTKFEIAIEKLKIKWAISRKKMGWAGIALGICTVAIGVVCAATGIGSILMGVLAAGAGVALVITGAIAVSHAKDCEKYVEVLEQIQKAIGGLQFLLEKYEKYNEKKDIEQREKEEKEQEIEEIKKIKVIQNVEKIQKWENEVSKWEREDIIKNIFRCKKFEKRYVKYQSKIEQIGEEIDLFDIDNLFDITEQGFKDDMNNSIKENPNLKVSSGIKNGLWKLIEEFQNEWKDVRN